MPVKSINIDIDEDKKELLTVLRKAFQSANLNFLIGSGCTYPAISPLGDIESSVQSLFAENKDNEAENTIFEFLKPFLTTTVELIGTPTSAEIVNSINNYRLFLDNISQILFERKSNLLPKQATIFSTNYDLFIEKAFEEINNSIRLYDGFNRKPSLTGLFQFSSSEFFNSLYNNGYLYSYKVQIPSINLIKLHGSLSWQIRDNEIIYSVIDAQELLKEYTTLKEKQGDISSFNNKFSIILPKKDKFKDTLLNQTYYDLLRLYANELDKENTILVTEGFSFADEHIFEITKRALKNPTLRLIIFCFKKDELAIFKDKFESFNNVDIAYSDSAEIPFERFNIILAKILNSKDNPFIKTQQGDNNVE